MELYLLRHGIAEDAPPGGSDDERALTAEGKKKLRQVLKTASEAKVSPTLILSSPLKRALQTAEIAKEELGYKNDLTQSKALIPGNHVEKVWTEIRAHKTEASVLLVGHNPLFAHLGAYLLGNENMQLDFKKGAILRIDLQSFGAAPRGILSWYLTPKLTSKR